MKKKSVVKEKEWKKRKPINKKCEQRKRMLIVNLENSHYQYPVTSEVYSDVKCQLHNLPLTSELPGRDALKEVITFLKTFKNVMEREQLYKFALKSALYKVQGRQFKDSKEKKGIIKSERDVVQVMRESLTTARIKYDSVEEFVYELLIS